MNLDDAERYFASFGWSIQHKEVGSNTPLQLRGRDGELIMKFDSALTLMTGWQILVQMAYAHERSVETAVRLAGNHGGHREAIRVWAASGGATALPSELDREINLRIARITGGEDAVLTLGKRLAPLIARERTDVAADVFARIGDQDRQTLDSQTPGSLLASGSTARL